MSMPNTRPPVSYQGSKVRVALEIVSHFKAANNITFYDVCCGSGAVSLAMVETGLCVPTNLIMIDSGPWGAVWKAVGNGSFNLSELEYVINRIPQDRVKVKAWADDVARKPIVPSEFPYTYLLLQAAAYGGKAVWRKNKKWIVPGFRAHWFPTATSVCRSQVNTMKPLPSTILKRMEIICKTMYGVTGYEADAFDIEYQAGSCIYVDPPYSGTTGYGETFSIPDFLFSCVPTACNVYISERKSLTPNAVKISTPGTRVGFSGLHKRHMQEWLNIYEHDARGDF